jgi:hypothetical protein
MDFKKHLNQNAITPIDFLYHIKLMANIGPRGNDGKEYACSVDVLKGNIKEKEELTDEEIANCMDVNTLIGTERWEIKCNTIYETPVLAVI